MRVSVAHAANLFVDFSLPPSAAAASAAAVGGVALSYRFSSAAACLVTVVVVAVLFIFFFFGVFRLHASIKQAPLIFQSFFFAFVIYFI